MSGINELVKRLRYPPEGLDTTIPMFEAADVIDRLLSQLPEGMKHCTIVFKECAKGHGRLIASNWIDHGCHWCALDKIHKVVEDLKELSD